MLDPKIIGVIVGRDLIGDALMKLPFIRALRLAYPTSTIRWITSQGPTAFSGALREATKGLLDATDECPPWVTGRLPSQAPLFDLLIDTRNRWRLALEARNIPHKVFMALALHGFLSDLKPSFFKARPEHLVDRLLQIIQLTAGHVPPSTGALPVADALLAHIEKLLPNGFTYVGFAPGAGNPIKIWPRYKFEQVAAAQIEKGRVPVFILGPSELNLYEELLANVPGAKFPLQECEEWSADVKTIDHTLALARKLDVAVANDSGVSHMLAAEDCRLISLFGPTSPAKLAPRVSRGKVICAQDYGSSEMHAIPWRSVDKAVDEMLSQS